MGERLRHIASALVGAWRNAFVCTSPPPQQSLLGHSLLWPSLHRQYVAMMNERAELELKRSLGMKCPICFGLSKPVSEIYTLGRIFESWRELGYEFSDKVRSSYKPDSQVRLLECQECRYGYFEPSVLGTSDFYNELASMGASWYYQEDKWEYQQALIHLSDRGRVLDVGCGAGFFLLRCRDRGLTVEGLELNPQAVAAARARGLLVHETTLDDFVSTHTGQYSAVCMFQVLEHVRDPLSTFTNALDCLGAAGLLIIGVPNATGILSRMSPLPSNVPPHHVTRWTPAALETLATRFGLDILWMKCEPMHRMLPAYLEERFFMWLPGRVRRSWPWRVALYAPVRMLRLLRPQGFDAWTGHTVFCVLRKP
jgi:SAM-dependent methyltransferase